MSRPSTLAIRLVILVLCCACPRAGLEATTAIVLRNRYRIVLAADSRALYGVNGAATECKLFELGDVYATMSGLVHYGRSYRATGVIREGFSAPGSFQTHVATTASRLQSAVQRLLNTLRSQNPAEYQRLLQPSRGRSDLVQLAVAQVVNRRPMLAIIELQAGGAGQLQVRTTICPGQCRQDDMYYLGYWDHIQPYVADSGQPRNVASAASLDRLIRMEIKAHPGRVGAPINVLEVNGSGAHWLQNGGNCSLPGVGW